MTPLGKVIFATLSAAVLGGAIFVLRDKPAPAAPHAQLTPSQLAEMQPPAKAPEPPRVVPTNDDAGQPGEPEIEDGSGS